MECRRRRRRARTTAHSSDRAGFAGGGPSRGDGSGQAGLSDDGDEYEDEREGTHNSAGLMPGIRRVNEKWL